MIRTRCLQRRAADALLQTPLPIPRPRHPLFFTLRYLSSSSPRRTSSETTPPSDAATLSPSPSPPFSTPFTPQPAPSSTSTTSPADTPQKHPRSKTPAGTPLKGLSWLKNQEPPKAWADDEYPEWLWSLLDAKKKKEAEGAGEGTGDFFSKSKKQRRIAAKAARNAAENPSSLIPEVPLHHQSIDLPYGEGSGEDELEGRKAREDLKKSMRVARRKGIKERNYLTGMK